MRSLQSALVAAALVGCACFVAASDPPAVQPKADKIGPRRSKADAAPLTEQPINELIAALKDPNPSARRQAATQLGARGAKAAEAVPALVTALKEDKEPAMRASAAEALGGIGLAAKAAVPPLLAAFKDADRSYAKRPPKPLPTSTPTPRRSYPRSSSCSATTTATCAAPPAPPWVTSASPPARPSPS